MKTNYLYKKRLIIFFLLIFISFNGICQQLNDAYVSMEYRDLIPENWETRLSQKIILESQDQIPGIWQGSYKQYDESPGTIQYKFDNFYNGFIIYKFLREDQDGNTEEMKAGNISIKRNINTLEYMYMTIIIKDDREDSYIRIFPLNSSSSLIDVKLFGIYLYKDVVLPIRFESLLTLPFSHIAELSSAIINWESIFYTETPDSDILQVIYKIREFLPFLDKEDDSAFDAAGEPVLIETGLASNGGVNCSGFTKWVIDGLYHSYTNNYIDIEDLKIRHFEYRGNYYSSQYEYIEDPFFGLDWSRNLAVILNEARLGININNPEQYDVRNIEHFYYIEDIGYRIIDLELILYLLSQQNPGHFYIGSINNQRLNPSLRQHMHAAVFFPVYDENGNFMVIVMENGYEITLDEFIYDYGYYPPGSTNSANEYIHLTEIYAKGDFEPLPFDGK